MNKDELKPYTRREKILKEIITGEASNTKPYTREEKILQYAAENGFGSGNEGGTSILATNFDSYVDKYIEKNDYNFENSYTSENGLRNLILNKDCYQVRRRLKKSGINIVDSNNYLMPLRGVGLHHILQYKNLFTKETFECLKYYGVNMIRISVYLDDFPYMYSDDNPWVKGYINNKAEHDEEIEKLIGICEELGMYILLDWHVMGLGTAGIAPKPEESLHIEEAKEFFEYYTKKYDKNGLMLYEIANEPYSLNATETMDFVKEIRTIITKNCTNPIMVMGRGKDGPEAMWNALKANNITDIFVCQHYYGVDGSSDILSLRAKNIPMFITEWGDSFGNDKVAGNKEACTHFINKLQESYIPMAVWKFTDQPCSCSILKYDTHINNAKYAKGFAVNDLTEIGKLYLNAMRRKAFINIDNVRSDYSYPDTEDLKNFMINGIVIDAGGLKLKRTVSKNSAGNAAICIPIKSNTKYKVIVSGGTPERFRLSTSNSKLDIYNNLLQKGDGTSINLDTMIVDNNSITEYEFTSGASAKYLYAYFMTSADKYKPLTITLSISKGNINQYLVNDLVIDSGNLKHANNNAMLCNIPVESSTEYKLTVEGADKGDSTNRFRIYTNATKVDTAKLLSQEEGATSPLDTKVIDDNSLTEYEFTTSATAKYLYAYLNTKQANYNNLVVNLTKVSDS